MTGLLPTLAAPGEDRLPTPGQLCHVACDGKVDFGGLETAEWRIVLTE